jgi:hypothetical protein
LSLRCRIEEEEVDLVGVLVLYDAPGEPPGAQQLVVDPDLAGDSLRLADRSNMNRDLRRNQAPVERAR